MDENQNLRSFLIEHEDLIKGLRFDELYTIAHLQFNGHVEKLTQLFLKADIDFLNYMTEIPANCFFMLNITTVAIPSNITSIGGSAFYNCKSLTSITIPSSVTSIGYDAFHGCTSLTAIYITDLDKWASIDFGGYANPLLHAKNLYLNGTLVTNATLTNATKISSCAFEGCASLTSIYIPKTVKFIGRWVFNYCNKNLIIYYEGSKENWNKINGSSRIDSFSIHYNS